MFHLMHWAIKLPALLVVAVSFVSWLGNEDGTQKEAMPVSTTPTKSGFSWTMAALHIYPFIYVLIH